MTSRGSARLLGALAGLDARTRLVALAATLMLVHAYSFQGGGWNPNAHFDVVRALVEQGRFEISHYADNTGDIAVVDGHVYSNKPPGLPLLVTPLYAVLYAAERAAGASPGEPGQAAINAYALTVLGSALPAVGTALLLFASFRREGGSEREALLLAVAFATGSLALPYSGVLMSHNLVAFLLFGAWLAITRDEARPRDLGLAGAMLGLAVLVDGLALLAAGVCSVVVAARRPSLAQGMAFGLAAAACAAVLFAHNLALFGHPLAGNQSHFDPRFLDSDLWLGTLDWPEPMRLYWLTFHPFRGLFYCCPLFLVPLASLLAKAPAPASAGTASGRTASRLAIVVAYLLFNVSFNGWAGGWSVGPRYLIPALPFAFSFALAGVRRLPLFAGVAMLASTAIMLSVSLVQLQIPAINEGPAPDENPVRSTFEQLARGEVSRTSQGVLDYVPGPPGARDDAAWNWGERLGLSGASTAVPVVALTGLAFALAWSGSPSQREGDPYTRSRPARETAEPGR